MPTRAAETLVEGYVHELRRLLAGLPPADVDDIAEEVRSHLREHIAEMGEEEPGHAMRSFGTPEEFADQVMERLGLTPGGSVTDARWPLRALARTVDAGVALLPALPLAVSPVFALGLIVGPAAGWSGMTPWTYLPVAAYLAACVLWAMWYLRWFPRRGHSGVGLRVTGLSRVRVRRRWRSVSSLAVAESEEARRRARPAYGWLFVAVPIVALTALVVVAFVSGIVGIAFQPWDWVGESVGQRADIERSMSLVDDFYAAVERGDADSASKLVAPEARPGLAAFVEEARAAGIVRHEIGLSDLPSSVGVWEYYDTEQGLVRRHVSLRVRRTDRATDDGGQAAAGAGRAYVTEYAIVELSRGRRAVPASDTATW